MNSFEGKVCGKPSETPSLGERRHEMDTKFVHNNKIKYTNNGYKDTEIQYLDRKRKLQVWITTSLDKKFRSLIQKKYGKYVRGLLSYEVEMALRCWISTHTNAQSQILRNRPNPMPKTAITFTQVKDYLLKNYYFELKPGQQIPRLHLERAIMAIRGSDPRTVKKWLEAFHKMGLIKPVTSATWKFSERSLNEEAATSPKMPRMRIHTMERRNTLPKRRRGNSTIFMQEMRIQIQPNQN